MKGGQKKIRATDAKEVGVENPAEETFRYPNQILFLKRQSRVHFGRAVQSTGSIRWTETLCALRAPSLSFNDPLTDWS